MLQRFFQFARNNGQFSYSILLIIFIPSLLLLNTVWILRSIDRDTNYQLRRQAVMAATITGTLLADQSATSSALSGRLQSVLEAEPNIQAITLLQYEQTNNTFRPTAEIGNSSIAITDPNLAQLAYTNKSSFASVFIDPKTNDKYWSVIVPVTNQIQGNFQLADVKITTKDVDQVIGRTIRDSLIVLVVSVVVVLLLLLNHLRFFEYAQLFNQLKQIDKMKDDFIAMASHELRTPLTAILGYAAVLQHSQSIAQDADTKHMTDMIANSGKRLATLVEDLLNVSRLEQGRMQFKIEAISLQTIIQSVVEELLPIAQEKQLSLTFIPVDQPKVLLDANRTREIFVNLIGNAIKYTQAGSVNVTQKIEDKQIRTYIKDTGIGMSPEDRQRLFEKFYRIRNSKTQNIAGTGLGLWITKQMVEKMKGKIFVDSIEGQGSQFTIIFPLND